MNILVISNNYPTLSQPNYGAFVFNLMQKLSKQNNITIITPSKFHDVFKKKHNGYGVESCKVLRPVYFSFGKKKIGKLNTGEVSAYLYRRSVQKEIRRLIQKPDVIYAHFLSNAIPAMDYAQKYNIPLVIASGESTYKSWIKNTHVIKQRLIDNVNHIICVSRENKDQLMELGFNNDKLTVIPNAVDYELFTPLDKEACKEKIGVAKNKFVVGFIGHFIHRKGPNRVIEAIESLQDNDIQFVCVGGRGQIKSNSFTKKIDPVPNYQLPEIYNSFDVFVLPTLHEGHCNAIEEAKACAIPIISSKGTSVEDQVDKNTGILVDPLDVNQIADAILTLRQDKALRASMSTALENKRGENSLEKRAEKINRILLNAHEHKKQNAD